jgi:hypothetical protein
MHFTSTLEVRLKINLHPILAPFRGGKWLGPILFNFRNFSIFELEIGCRKGFLFCVGFDPNRRYNLSTGFYSFHDFFADAVEFGSITSSAEKNLVSHPAVSRAIRAIEDQLGVKLLVCHFQRAR